MFRKRIKRFQIGGYVQPDNVYNAMQQGAGMQFLAKTVDEIDRLTNYTRPDSPNYNPNIITGEAPVIGSAKGFQTVRNGRSLLNNIREMLGVSINKPIKYNKSLAKYPVENPIGSDAEMRAAQDFMNSTGLKVSTTRRRGRPIQDVRYNDEQMARIKANNEKKIEVTAKPKRTEEQIKEQNRLNSQHAYQEKKEDRTMGIGKRKRRDFKQQETLNDGDARHYNSGRTRFNMDETIADATKHPWARKSVDNLVKRMVKSQERGNTENYEKVYKELKKYLQEDFIPTKEK